MSADTPRPEPVSPTLTYLPRDEHVLGRYESRAKQGILHELVNADLVGFRTYVYDGRVVTEAMVLPHDRNSSYGFIALSNFVVRGAGNHPPIRRPAHEPAVDRPF